MATLVRQRKGGQSRNPLCHWILQQIRSPKLQDFLGFAPWPAASLAAAGWDPHTCFKR